MRKLQEETRVFIAELYLSGWTPEQITESGLVEASTATVQRIARAEGVSRPQGAAVGHAAYPGGGRPSGTFTSQHREAVLALRDIGFSWREIAQELGLRSYQHAQQLAKDLHRHDAHAGQFTDGKPK